MRQCSVLSARQARGAELGSSCGEVLGGKCAPRQSQRDIAELDGCISQRCSAGLHCAHFALLILDSCIPKRVFSPAISAAVCAAGGHRAPTRRHARTRARAHRATAAAAGCHAPCAGRGRPVLCCGPWPRGRRPKVQRAAAPGRPPPPARCGARRPSSAAAGAAFSFCSAACCAASGRAALLRPATATATASRYSATASI